MTFIGRTGHGVCFWSLHGGSVIPLGEDGVSSEGCLEAESTVWTNKAAEVVLGTKLVWTGP